MDRYRLLVMPLSIITSTRSNDCVGSSPVFTIGYGFLGFFGVF